MMNNLEKDKEERTYTRSIDIWGSPAAMIVNVDDDLPMSDETAAKVLSITEEVSGYLEKSRDLIGQIVIDNGFLGTANDWLSQTKKNENGKGIFSAVTKLMSSFGKNKNDAEAPAEDVTPITEEEFRKSLFIDEAALYIDSDFDYSDSIEIYVVCKPDHLKGHSIEIILNTDGTADEVSLFG